MHQRIVLRKCRANGWNGFRQQVGRFFLFLWQNDITDKQRHLMPGWPVDLSISIKYVVDSTTLVPTRENLSIVPVLQRKMRQRE